MAQIKNDFDRQGSGVEGTEELSFVGPLNQRRDTLLCIPTTYHGINSGPLPGTVAGIVLGAVAGFLLILWLIYTCKPQNGFGFARRSGGGVAEEETIRRYSRSPRRRRPPSRSHSSSSRRTRRSGQSEEIVEVIEEHSPVRYAEGPPRTGYNRRRPSERPQRLYTQETTRGPGGFEDE